ncbi:FkbM family methyltransferase [Paenibacillus lautus]|uniref:FkbM family methyltransferase n=1 Tax=Paenibacillus lautus TaxID=1401 RepID=UPI003D27EACA
MSEFESIEHEVIYKKLKDMLLYEEKDTTSLEKTNVNKETCFHDLDRNIKVMLRTRENFAYRPLYSHRKVTGSFIIFFKKVIRKILKWYIEPIAFQQTDFNNAVTPSIGRLTELTAQLEKDNLLLIDSFNDKIEEKNLEYKGILEQLVHEQERLNNDMRNRILELEKKNEIQAETIENITTFLNRVNDQIDIVHNNKETIFYKNTFSQSGEDSILAYIIHVLGIPFDSVRYIDLGANHAKEMSNTYYFYSKGARGVLVEANPELIPELKYFRNRDIILNYAVDTIPGHEIDFHILNGDGLSTPDLESARSFCEINPELEITSTKKVETIDYKTIVEEYLGLAPTIISIDIEGKELDILKSIDYENYGPLIIVVEMIEYSRVLNYRTKNTEIINYLDSVGYDEYAFTGINSVFIQRSFLEERKLNP